MTTTPSSPPPDPPPPATNERTRPRSPTVDLPTKRRRKQKSNKAGKPRRDTRKSRYDADYTGDDERNNAHLEAYYREQAIVPAEEMDTLFATLATPLPTSFRITASGKDRDQILQQLRGEMTALFENVKGGEKGEGEIKPPMPLKWYEEDLAWTVSAPRQMLRRDNVLAPFHKFLVQMHELGAINRQEAVSMIPPLMLDVQPGHSVIDMCAAPGSKTAQILEGICNDDGEEVRLKRRGLVIANDADIRRCWMLTHQLKRFASSELVVTQHDAQYFPKVMMFDRVLCDVPCTGDGTLRKAPDIWRRWTPDMGIGIHRLQRQILERGVDLLRGGGRLVYSTCSMNPLENEAVVAHALRTFGEDIELVDVKEVLPELKRREGLMTWKVKDNSSNVGKVKASRDGMKDDETGKIDEGATANTNGKMRGVKGDDSKTEKKEGWFTSFDEVPLRRRKKIVRSLFPPSKEEVESGCFPLTRCMRLVPHDQDTGAFFVAVFEKRKDARVHRKLRHLEEGREQAVAQGAEKEDIGMVQDDGEEKEGDVDAKAVDAKDAKDAKVAENGAKRKDRGGTRLITDDPLVSVAKLNKGMLGNITHFFGIEDSVGLANFMTRGSDGETFKRVVAISPQVGELLSYSLGSRDGKVRKMDQSIRVVNAGVRILERTDRRDTTCPFRLIHEGLQLVCQVMTKRVARTEDETFIKQLVGQDAVKLDSLQCEELKQQLMDMKSGSCIVEWMQQGKAAERIVAWKGRSNIAVVMPREQVRAVQQRLGVAAGVSHEPQVLEKRRGEGDMKDGVGKEGKTG